MSWLLHPLCQMLPHPLPRRCRSPLATKILSSTTSLILNSPSLPPLAIHSSNALEIASPPNPEPYWLKRWPRPHSGKPMKSRTSQTKGKHSSTQSQPRRPSPVGCGERRWHRSNSSLPTYNPPTLAGLIRLRECPEGFQANDARLPDFIIHTPNGQSIQAPFIKYIDGTQYVAGTLRGDDERLFTHLLFANPIVSIETYPDVLPNWLIQLLGSKSPAFATLVIKASLLDDWGLSTDIERYHNLNKAAVELGDEITHLQLQQADALNSLWLCHARLAQAKAG